MAALVLSLSHCTKTTKQTSCERTYALNLRVVAQNKELFGSTAVSAVVARTEGLSIEGDKYS